MKLLSDHEKTNISDADREQIQRIMDRRESLGQLPEAERLRIRRASMGADNGRSVFRFVKTLGPCNILEIGTCVGIGAAYMCLGAEAGEELRRKRFVGTEGDPEKHALACATLEQLLPLGTTLVEWKVVLGDFDETLEQTIKVRPGQPPWDLVYIDGQHQGDKTIRNFNWCLESMLEGVVLVDDLNYNSGMKKAEAYMRRHKRISQIINVGKLLAFVISPK